MSEVRGVRDHQIKPTNTLSGVLGTPLTMGSVASNPGVQGVGQSLASLQYMALQQQQQQQQQYMALQQQYLPQHDTAFNGTVIGTQGKSTKVKIILNIPLSSLSTDMNSPEMSQLTLMSLLQQQQSSALTGNHMR